MSYTPDRKDIAKLGPHEAERLMQVILWAHADRLGASREVIDAIEIPTVSRRPKPNVKDGGLELTVRLPSSIELKHPFSHHNMIVQVKSGAKLLTGSGIEEEVSKEKVKAFFATGGHYVIAYTGFVPTYGEHDENWAQDQLNELRKAIKKHYPKNNVTGEIWVADDIERLTADAPQSWDIFGSGNPFATLTSQTLKNLNDRRVLADMGFDIPFVKGGPREEQLKSLQSWMHDFRGYFELRGNMGVGKSRLAYEAVISTARDGTTIWNLARPDSSFITSCQSYLSSHPSANLRMVVDECDDDMAERLKTLAQLNKDRVSLLAIIPFKSRDATTKTLTNVHLVSKMTKDDLKGLLATFNLKDEVVDWIVQICDGYPKLARVLAEKSKVETDKLSREQLIVWLSEHNEFRDQTIATRGWVNLILDPDDQQVLGVLALLTEVGFSGKRKSEYQTLCDFFKLEPDKVEKAIRKNLAKGLIASGSDYIYVTPLILASYLCADRLGTIRTEKFQDLGNILHQFPRPHSTASALESLTERIKMSALTEDIQQSLLKVLEGFRPFDKAILQSEVVAELAFAYAYFQPQAFLKSFAGDLRQRDPQDIKTWVDGRRKTVQFLEAAAFYPELFDNAIDGLFLLSKAENETWGNNASGIWVEFFSAGLSGSMAPFSARVDWLVRRIASNDPAHELIEKAIEKVLSPNHSRMTGHENRLGLPRLEVDHGFKWSEYYESVRRLLDAIKKSDYRIPYIAKIIARNLRGLVRRGYLQRNLELVTWLQDLAKADLELQQEVLSSCRHILEWEQKRLTPEAKAMFEELNQSLDHGTIENSIRRWAFAPLLKDYEIEKEEDNPFKKLVIHLIANSKDFIKAGKILTDPRATRAWYFLFKIGELDKERICWDLFDQWSLKRKVNELKMKYIVGRFFGGENPTWVDDQLDEFSLDADSESLANASKDVETDRSFARLLLLAKSRPEFLRLLVFGGRASRLTNLQVQKIIDFFQSGKVDADLSPLWDILGQYTNDRKDIPLPVSAAHVRFLFASLLAPTVGTMTEYYQDNTLRILLSHHLNNMTAKELVVNCLDVIMASGTKYERSHRTGELLKAVAGKWGETAFEAIVERLDSEESLPLFKLEQVLDDWAYGIFHDIMSKMSETCDEQRAERLVRLMPNSFASLNETSAILLRRFPGNERISNAVARSFFSGVFWGPITNRLEEQISALDSWTKQYSLENLNSIRQVRESLARQLKDERDLEEEEDFLNKKDR
jgi:hypothetical protein